MVPYALYVSPGPPFPLPPSLRSSCARAAECPDHGARELRAQALAQISEARHGEGGRRRKTARRGGEKGERRGVGRGQAERMHELPNLRPNKTQSAYVNHMPK